jgi:hypothetical protein
MASSSPGSKLRIPWQPRRRGGSGWRWPAFDGACRFFQFDFCFRRYTNLFLVSTTFSWAKYLPTYRNNLGCVYVQLSSLRPRLSPEKLMTPMKLLRKVKETALLVCVGHPQFPPPRPPGSTPLHLPAAPKTPTPTSCSVSLAQPGAVYVIYHPNSPPPTNHEL